MLCATCVRTSPSGSAAAVTLLGALRRFRAGMLRVVRWYAALRRRYLCDMIQYLITEMHVEVKCCYIFGLWREALPHSLS